MRVSGVKTTSPACRSGMESSEETLSTTFTCKRMMHEPHGSVLRYTLFLIGEMVHIDIAVILFEYFTNFSLSLSEEAI